MSQVQEALLHSQVVFQRQASVVEQAVLARAFWVGVQRCAFCSDGLVLLGRAWQGLQHRPKTWQPSIV